MNRVTPLLVEFDFFLHSDVSTSLMDLSLLGQGFFVTVNLELGSLSFFKCRKAYMYI